MFFNFIKSKRVKAKVSFFQTSYHSSNLLIEFKHFFNKKWWKYGPHPSDSYRYSGLDSGHYGLYYPIFTHDSDLRRRGKVPHVLGNQVPEQIHGASFTPGMLDEGILFYILKVNNEILNSLVHLKTKSEECLSTLSLSKRKASRTLRRYFTTDSRRQNKIARQEDVVEREVKGSGIKSEVPFEESFLDTQVANIRKISSKCDPVELNLVYPIYQSLKRNEINLPSVELYNVVLESISRRSLDNEDLSIESIESKLTNLLSVYQDLLQVASYKEFKPDGKTYEIVIRELFKGSLQTLSIGVSPKLPRFICDDSFRRALEYARVGVDLFFSVCNVENVDFSDVVIPMLRTLNKLHGLLDKNLGNQLLAFCGKINPSKGLYYVSLVEIAPQLSTVGVFELKKDVYEFIFHSYDKYKEILQHYPMELESQNTMYIILIKSLSLSGNFPLATKFLDDILVDYKKNLDDLPENRISKMELSNLLSVYLESVMAQKHRPNSLAETYDLLRKFNLLTYLPELSVRVYNNLIVAFTSEFYQLEAQKSVKNGYAACSDHAINERQNRIYKIIWELYNYMAIRKDYYSENLEASGDQSMAINCREPLLSLSLDLEDYAGIFQLVKELLVKKPVIQEWEILRKLCSHLLHRAYANELNLSYLELIVQLIEGQASHLQSCPRMFFVFLSRMSDYLTWEPLSFNVDILLNSSMVTHAFQEFLLQRDDIMGLVNISNLFIWYLSQNTIQQREVLLGILHNEALLINEFENIDNHYVTLNDFAVNFKEQLISNFLMLSSLLEINGICGNSLSKEMFDALRSNGVVLKEENTQLGPQGSFEHVPKVNLSYFLNANYPSGIKSFIDLFLKGYNFSLSTWMIVLNQNFVFNCMERSRMISFSGLIERVLSLNLKPQERRIVLERIYSLGSDKFLIHLLKYMTKNINIVEPKLLSSMVSVVEESQNLYLQSTLNSSFLVFYRECCDSGWVSRYFNYVESSNDFNAINRILDSDISFESLSLDKEDDLMLLQLVLKLYLKAGRYSEFNELFQCYFNNTESYKFVKNSNGLINIILKYNLLNGSFEFALKEFGNIVPASPEVKELIYVNQINGSLSNNSFSRLVGKCYDCGELAFNILKSNSTDLMMELHKCNLEFSKFALFNSSMRYFIVAASLNSHLGKSQHPLLGRFQTFLSFMKFAGFTKLSLKSFVQVIHFLTITGLNELLNIISNRFIASNGLAGVFKFQHLEVRTPKTNDKLGLLRILRDSFYHLKDRVNYSVIESFCKDNDIYFEGPISSLPNYTNLFI